MAESMPEHEERPGLPRPKNELAEGKGSDVDDDDSDSNRFRLPPFDDLKYISETLCSISNEGVLSFAQMQRENSH
jgi:hypothetical protein